MLYPGMRVKWRFPRTHKSINQKGELENDFGDKVRNFARGGISNIQPRPELVPFDYTDVSVNYAAALAHFGENAFTNLTFEDHFKRDKVTNVAEISGRQEAAGGHWYGTAGILAGALEMLVALGLVKIEITEFEAGGKVDETKVNNIRTTAPGKSVKEADVKAVRELLQVLGVWEKTPDKRAVFAKVWKNINL